LILCWHKDQWKIAGIHFAGREDNNPTRFNGTGIQWKDVQDALDKFLPALQACVELVSEEEPFLSKPQELRKSVEIKNALRCLIERYSIRLSAATESWLGGSLNGGNILYTGMLPI
jgi:hypothetical protein